jgi:hypothetical protein
VADETGEEFMLLILLAVIIHVELDDATLGVLLAGCTLAVVLIDVTVATPTMLVYIMVMGLNTDRLR